jgi:hypothetical protein
MSNADRAAVIAGLDSLSLGSGGGAVRLLKELEDSMNFDAMNSHPSGNPCTWAEAFQHMKAFETAVKVEAQVADWMSGKRARWIAFCDNVDNQHPAGFATAVLGLDISIKPEAQAASWMSSDRGTWVARCRGAGAQDFDYDSAGFVVSGLDGCEVLLDSVARSIPDEHLSRPFAAGDYKTYGSLFQAVKDFEVAIKASAQNPDWMTGKRDQWLAFCNNSANHTPSGFATAVMALDMSVPGSNNVSSWLSGSPSPRDRWMVRCRNAGGSDFSW